MMGKRTALYKLHIEEHARMVDFGGWEMPLHYGSQLQEHHQVRRTSGMFDVSHMTIVDIAGKQAQAYLQRLLANDVGKLESPGQALYGCLLNDGAGIIDDLIVYFLAEHAYRMVVNAATRDKDLAWMRNQAEAYEVNLQIRDDLAMIAVQGPGARAAVLDQLDVQERSTAGCLASFTGASLGALFIARTGYTGEDGFEIMLPNQGACVFWENLKESGVQPAGLGARDTLRLEAGLNLYGADMDEEITPLECGLAWTVAWKPPEREFIGRVALQTQRTTGVKFKRVGLVLEGKAVPRGHQKVVVEGVGNGEITSGTFSPTLGKGIALARVPVSTGDSCQVEIRNKRLIARVVTPPFVRDGKSRLS
jgi:aminomethyltransferase